MSCVLAYNILKGFGRVKYIQHANVLFSFFHFSYGLPSGTNAFFEDECQGVVVAIYFQMVSYIETSIFLSPTGRLQNYLTLLFRANFFISQVWSMMFNAFLFSFFFARIAKSESRGVQVIFSNRAIVSRRPESQFPCLSFRVFDVDARHPVVEAHVRLYVVSQKSPIPMPLRILIPNDDLGAMLYLSLPSQVVHTIDGYSPLAPKLQAKCGASATVPTDGLNLRQVDSSTNNRDDVNCPVCGESYGTVDRLIKHGKFNSMTEKHDDIPYFGSHQEVDWNEWRDLLKKSTTWTMPQLEAYFRSSISEILCVVEGIDPLASGTFQALHSYQGKSDSREDGRQFPLSLGGLIYSNLNLHVINPTLTSPHLTLPYISQPKTFYLAQGISQTAFV